MKLRRHLGCYFINAASRAAAVAIFVLTFNSATVFAESEMPLPIPIVWEQSFGDEQYSYQSKAALIASTGMLTVVGTYAPISKKFAPPKGIWIWKVDGQGKKVSDVRFGSDYLGSAILGVDACELLEGDVVAMVVQLRSGKSSLVYVDASGKIVKTVDLGNRRIAKLFRMGGSSLMLAGQKNGDMLLMKLDKADAISWEKLTDRGKDDSIIDGNVSADSFLFVELSGRQGQFIMTDSVLGLVTPSVDGKIGAPAFSIKGRGGSIARNSKRTILVYDAEMSSEQDMKFVMLDNKFHDIQEASIIKGKIALEKFRVALAGESGFIVAGTIGGKMILTFIDMDGQVKWQRTRANNVAFFVNPEVLGGSYPYVVSTMMVLTSDKQPKTLVNILKIDSSPSKH